MGRRLAKRKHFRQVYETPEIARSEHMEQLREIRDALGDLVVAEQSAAKSWYKKGDPDIQVLDGTKGRPLSEYSDVVRNLAKNNQIKLFSKPDDAQKSRKRIEEALGTS